MKRIVASLVVLLTVGSNFMACSITDDNNTLDSEYISSDEVTRIESPFYEETTNDETTVIEDNSVETTNEEEPESTSFIIETTIVATAPEVATPKDTENKTTKYYTITTEEREMIARLVTLEAGICSLECQKGVASVIFNRLDDGRWGGTLHDIVYYPAAFSPAYLIPTTVASESAYIAVDYVVENGPTLPTQVRYFRADYDFNWVGYKNYTTMDNTYFGYLEGWENGAW